MAARTELDTVDTLPVGGVVVAVGTDGTLTIGATPLTVTLHLYFLEPVFAVITAEPAFFAVTTPFFVTDATFFLVEDHLTFFLVPLTLSLYVFPTYNESFFLLSPAFASAVAGLTFAIPQTNNAAANTIANFLHIFFILFSSFHIIILHYYTNFTYIQVPEELKYNEGIL